MKLWNARREYQLFSMDGMFLDKDYQEAGLWDTG